MLRVPLSEIDYVNIGHEFGSGVEPMVLAGFAGVLRKVLEPKLPLLHGDVAPAAPLRQGRWRTLSASWKVGFSPREALVPLRNCGTEAPRGLKATLLACSLRTVAGSKGGLG